MKVKSITGLKVQVDKTIKLFREWRQDRRDFEGQVNLFGRESVAIRNLPVLIVRDDNDKLSHVATRVIYKEYGDSLTEHDGIPMFFPHYFRLSDSSEVNTNSIVGCRDIREFKATEDLFDTGLTSVDVKCIDQTEVILAEEKSSNKRAYGKK